VSCYSDHFIFVPRVALLPELHCIINACALIVAFQNIKIATIFNQQDIFYILTGDTLIYYIPIKVLLKIQAVPSSEIQTSESHFPYHHSVIFLESISFLSDV